MHVLPTVSLDYFKLIARAAAENKAEAVLSRAPEHIPFILKTLFEQAVEKAEIVTTALNPEFYGDRDVVNAVVQFLKAGTKNRLDILADELPGFRHPLILALQKEDLGGQVKLAQVKADENFVLIDAQHFRYQQSRDALDGVVQFGSFIDGRLLRKNFEGYKSHSIPQPFPPDFFRHRATHAELMGTSLSPRLNAG